MTRFGSTLRITKLYKTKPKSSVCLAINFLVSLSFLVTMISAISKSSGTLWTRIAREWSHAVASSSCCACWPAAWRSTSRRIEYFSSTCAMRSRGWTTGRTWRSTTCSTCSRTGRWTFASRSSWRSCLRARSSSTRLRRRLPRRPSGIGWMVVSDEYVYKVSWVSFFLSF